MFSNPEDVQISFTSQVVREWLEKQQAEFHERNRGIIVSAQTSMCQNVVQGVHGDHSSPPVQILETTIKNPQSGDGSIKSHKQASLLPDLTLTIVDSVVQGTMDKICNGTLPTCQPTSVFDLKVATLKLNYRSV